MSQYQKHLGLTFLPLPHAFYEYFPLRFEIKEAGHLAAKSDQKWDVT